MKSKALKTIIGITTTVLLVTNTQALNLESLGNKQQVQIESLVQGIDKFKLDVDVINQNPELPSGCEIVSGAILLKYLGYNVDKLDLADNYLRKTEYWWGADPEHEYMGNPRIQKGINCGFYVWTAPIVDACNRYIDEHDQQIGNERRLKDISGSSFDDLKQYIVSGRPVAVWVTIGFVEPQYQKYTWVSEYGNQVRVRKNVHCLVMTGYNEQENIVYLADPLGKNQEISEERFNYIWNAMGNRAVTIE